MSATADIRVDLADTPTLEQASWRPPHLRVERYVRVESSLEHTGTAVLLEAESLEALHDWLETAAAQVHAAMYGYCLDAPDTDAAAADAGAPNPWVGAVLDHPQVKAEERAASEDDGVVMS